MLNDKVYVKAVNSEIASRWAMEVINIETAIKGHVQNDILCHYYEFLIGIDTDEERWMGIRKDPADNTWDLMLSGGFMDNSNDFKYQLMAIAGEGDWVPGSCAIYYYVNRSSIVRNKWDGVPPSLFRMYEGISLPEVSDEYLLDFVHLEGPHDPATNKKG